MKLFISWFVVPRGFKRFEGRMVQKFDFQDDIWWPPWIWADPDLWGGGNNLQKWIPHTREPLKWYIVHQFWTTGKKLDFQNGGWQPSWIWADPDLWGHNNPRNRYLIPENPWNDILYINFGQGAQKLDFQDSRRRPFWFYANYRSCPKLPIWQPSWICSGIPGDTKHEKTSLYPL